MSELGKDPKPPESISPVILEKLSKGNIQLGEGIVIQGEDEERKITATLTPDDPSYLDYLENVDLFTKRFSNIAKQAAHNQEFGDSMIALALRTRNALKKHLDTAVIGPRVNKYFIDRIRQEVMQDEAERALESTNLGDLFKYVIHLTAQKAYEVILPEQQTEQEEPQK